MVRKNIFKCFMLSIQMLGVIATPEILFANWMGPYEVIKGGWGAEVGEFGYVSGDPSDGFPEAFLIDESENLIIADSFNKRVQIFKDGYINAFTYKDLNPGWEVKLWPSNTIANYGSIFIDGGFVPYQFYDYKGNLVRELKIPDGILKEVDCDGKMIVMNYKTKVYSQYSENGELLKTYKEKPLELGVVDTQRSGTGEKKYRTLLKYPDHAYEIYSRQPFVDYYRDQLKNLYRVESYVERKDEQHINVYRVFKYGICDDKEIVFEMPKSDYEPRPPEADNYPTWKSVPIIEYGEPQISPNGNIYCWARTKTEYKILKWIWQGDFDAPQSLTAKSLESTTLLEWKPPTQNSEEVTGYEIIRSTEVCGPYGPIESVSKSVLQFEDNTVGKDITYYYQVRAVKKDGYSGDSNKAVGHVR